MVLVHNGSMKMEGVNATKTDYIANELRKLLNGQTKYGYGKLDLVSNTENVLNDKYQYRELIFYTTDLRESVDKNPPFRKLAIR